jgi:hypothetical protein
MMDLVPGRYLVRVGTIVNQPGAQQQNTYYPSGTNTSQALRLEVGPGGIVDRIDFRLRPETLYHVRGTLTGASKLQGTVFIQDCAAVQAGFNGFGQIGADGTFDVPGIRPGSYCVNFGEKVSFDSDILSFATGRVTVVDRDVDGVALVAAPPFQISGSILFEEGSTFPMPTALSLTPRSAFPATTIESTVDESGRFQLGRVLPLDYRLRLAAPVGSYIKSIKAGGQDFTSGVFNPLGVSGALTIQIAAARGRITGRVNNGSDKPAAGLMVTIAAEPHRPDLMKTAVSDERGEFAVDGLAPGSYELLAWERHDPRLAQAPEFLNLFSGTPLKLSDGETRDVTVRMIPVREVEEAKARF